LILREVGFNKENYDDVTNLNPSQSYLNNSSIMVTIAIKTLIITLIITINFKSESTILVNKGAKNNVAINNKNNAHINKS